MKHLFVFLIFIPLFISCTSKPGGVNEISKEVIYEKRVEMIPMRDGIKLHTEIYQPKGNTDPLPIIITRTPYGQGHDSTGTHWALRWNYKHLAQEKYIFVFQDIRGRYESEGQFVMLRPVRTNENEIDEGTDTFDTIEWLLNNTDNNNGKAGILGISYDGWLAVMALIEPHPALSAAIPQASPSDMFIGDDFVHNGAFRLSPSFGYAALMESAKTNKPFQYGTNDVYDFYLQLGALSNANKKYFHDSLPSWNNFMQHPSYDDYWQSINVDHNLHGVSVPTLNVAGWWDAEDFYGPLKIYKTLEAFDSKNQNFMVIGPWKHGGWAGPSGDSLGMIAFGSRTSEYYQENIQAVFFKHFLKNQGEWDIEEALTFQTGSNQWRSYDTWPPVLREQKWYFNTSGTLDLSEATFNEKEYLDFISDPSNPVPYTKRPVAGFWQEPKAKALWKVEDQRFVSSRPDVLSWNSEVLTEDICITGNVIASFHASTSGTDCDWILKLIDVYPENGESDMSGYQLMIADEVLRAKYRNSFSDPEPLIPDQVVPFKIDLNIRNHCFKKGHKIMVQIQSTWFPLIDRNPQRFIDIPEAKDTDFQTSVQKVFNTKDYPSFVIVSVENQ